MSEQVTPRYFPHQGDGASGADPNTEYGQAAQPWSTAGPASSSAPVNQEHAKPSWVSHPYPAMQSAGPPWAPYTPADDSTPYAYTQYSQPGAPPCHGPPNTFDQSSAVSAMPFSGSYGALHHQQPPYQAHGGVSASSYSSVHSPSTLPPQMGYATSGNPSSYGPQAQQPYDQTGDDASYQDYHAPLQPSSQEDGNTGRCMNPLCCRRGTHVVNGEYTVYFDPGSPGRRREPGA